MAGEDNDVEVKKKSSKIKIIIFALIGLIVVGAAVAGGLYFTGFFDAKDEETAEAKLEALEKEAAAANDPLAKKAEEKRVTRKSPELTRFEQRYLELERDLIANLTNSRKVMQIQLAVMTQYDQRVFDNVKKHEFALRSVTLDVMRKTTEDDLAKPDFRVQLAEKIRTEINATLEKYEDFGGIEAVYFTSFVVQ